VPLYWRRRAAADLRRAGAVALAERVEGAAGSEAWHAMAGFLARAGEGSLEEAAGELFARSGYPEVRLTLEGVADAWPLRAGAGGPDELSATVGAGTLRLSAPLIDAVLRALFAAVVSAFGSRPEPARVQTPAGLAADVPSIAGLTGRSPNFLAALRRAEALAAGRLPVLVRGETGTGKERVARLIHDRSPRAAAAFVPINCAALSETLVLSDLFGHVRGAFTGAERDRPGVFEAARGGTVFLDEVGDLPASAQGMLLRVLQEGEVRRLGESVARHVDVRVVTATHRDLGNLVAQGSFRQDLYFRLAVAEVELPPLRARGDDLWLLIAQFLEAAAPPARLTDAARLRLREHSWPGNVRELENAVAVAAALSQGAPVDVPHLPRSLQRRAGTLEAAAPAASGTYHEQVEDFRRGLIATAVAESGGNLAAAARRLGLTRQALSYLVRQLGLTSLETERRRVGRG
jgi:transcriptional regulator with GAF, ATPase, and Fis domain